jgi:Ca2+-binding RTX toxin-like protein
MAMGSGQSPNVLTTEYVAPVTSGMSKMKGTSSNETLIGTAGGDRLFGMDGNDTLIDAGGRTQSGIDAFRGGNGEDMIYSHFGRDWMWGGADHDHLISRSDGGEPDIAQETDAEKVYPNENLSQNKDTLIGGGGNDEFFFRLDLNAKAEIIAEHTDDEGDIDWEGVTGENDNPHDHWLDSIGNDRIMDFSDAEGDVIKIEGHTVEYEITYKDLNGDGKEESIIRLYSQQGDAGAHDEDELGTITVYGDRVEDDDIEHDNMVHYGAFDNITDIPLV